MIPPVQFKPFRVRAPAPLIVPALIASEPIVPVAPEPTVMVALELSSTIEAVSAVAPLRKRTLPVKVAVALLLMRRPLSPYPIPEKVAFACCDQVLVSVVSLVAAVLIVPPLLAKVM